MTLLINSILIIINSLLFFHEGQKNHVLFMVLLVGFIIAEASYISCSSQCKLVFVDVFLVYFLPVYNISKAK